MSMHVKIQMSHLDITIGDGDIYFNGRYNPEMKHGCLILSKDGIENPDLEYPQCRIVFKDVKGLDVMLDVLTQLRDGMIKHQDSPKE